MDFNPATIGIFVAVIVILIIVIFLAIGSITPEVPLPPPQATAIHVTVQPKTRAHPYYGRGSMLGYAINGKEGAKLNLVRNVNYRFFYDGFNPSDHPFYFSSSASGGKNGVDPIAGFPVPIPANTNITLPASAPTDFYYQCTLHEYMGGPVDPPLSTPAVVTNPTTTSVIPMPAVPSTVVPQMPVRTQGSTGAASMGLPSTNASLPLEEPVEIFGLSPTVGESDGPLIEPVPPAPQEFLGSTTNPYVITVRPKTPNHPLYGVGSDLGFVINGVEYAQLELQRGVIYAFSYNDPLAPQHPFYLTTSDVGGTGNTDPVTGPGIPNPIIGNVSVTLPPTAPDLFYYECQAHPYMGGPIIATN